MEIKTNELNKNKNISSGRVSAMKLDGDSQAMIFQMFTGGLYSDPVGTVIREITSNCFDSHVEAGVDSKKVPVIVRLGNDLSGNHISFLDKGMGMSPDRLENIYGTYFKSTKRGTNDQIGGFGLGGKTPLSYTESFYVITVSTKENEIDFCRVSIESAYNELNNTKKKIKALEIEKETDIPVSEKDMIDQDIIVLKEKVTQLEADVDYFLERLDSSSKITTKNVKYIYDIFEDTKQPSIDLLKLEATEEHLGTEIKVPIKKSDLHEFEKKTLRQLYYFENIIFEGFSQDYVTNDYQIIRGKNFIYRGERFDSKIHACYGRVAYPLDYETLGISSSDYNIPLAIRLEIGELEGTGVTPSREALKYSTKNIKIIRNKIENALEELKMMLSKQHENVTTLEEYFFVKENATTLKMSNGEEIHLGNVIKADQLDFPNFKYRDITMPECDSLFSSLYDVHLYGKKPSRTRYGRRDITAWDGKLSSMDSYTDIYYNDSFFERKVTNQAYLRFESVHDRFYIVTPYRLDDHALLKIKARVGLIETVVGNLTPDLDDPTSYKHKINKRKADKLLNDLIGDMHALMVKRSTERYDDVVLSQEFIDYRKGRKVNKNVLKEGIPLKSYHDKYTTAAQRHSFEKLVNFKGRIYYGFQNDTQSLDHASGVMNRLPSARYMVNTNNLNLHGKGIMFVQISKANEKYMNMLGKKAFHVDYFYETFLSRKVDDMQQSHYIELVLDMFINSVDDKLKNIDVMQHVNTDICDAVKKVKSHIDHINNNLHKYVSSDLLERKLKVKFDNEIKIEKTPVGNDMKYLMDITNKSGRRLKWFDLPHRIHIENEAHKELLFMLKMMIEK